MKSIRLLGLACLISVVVAHGQSRDSVMLDRLNKGLITNDDYLMMMYIEGHITHGSLFVSSAHYRHGFFAKRVRFIKNLRRQLRNKYALDFLVTARDTTFQESNPAMREDTREDFQVVKDNNPRVDEAFVLLGTKYLVYRCPSFDGKKSYRLVAKGPGVPLERFDLFDATAKRPARLDSFRVAQPTGGGSFRFDTINGGTILRVEDSTWGYKQLEANLYLLAVRNGKFVRTFRTRTVELLSEGDTTARRVLRRIALGDANGDGLLDLRESVAEDLVNPGKRDLREAGGLKVISHRKDEQNVYLWNASKLSFERTAPK